MNSDQLGPVSPLFVEAIVRKEASAWTAAEKLLEFYYGTAYGHHFSPQMGMDPYGGQMMPPPPPPPKKSSTLGTLAKGAAVIGTVGAIGYGLNRMGAKNHKAEDYVAKDRSGEDKLHSGKVVDAHIAQHDRKVLPTGEGWKDTFLQMFQNSKYEDLGKRAKNGAADAGAKSYNEAKEKHEKAVKEIQSGTLSDPDKKTQIDEKQGGFDKSMTDYHSGLTEIGKKLDLLRADSSWGGITGNWGKRKKMRNIERFHNLMKGAIESGAHVFHENGDDAQKKAAHDTLHRVHQAFNRLTPQEIAYMHKHEIFG